MSRSPAPDALADTAPPRSEPPAIEGVVDVLLGPEKLFGWALDPAAPGDHRLEIVAMRGGQALARTRTGHPRADLAGRGNGRHGFILDLAGQFAPGDLAAGRLRLHPLAADGMVLPPLPLHRALLAQERVAAAALLLAQAEAMLGQARLQQVMAMLGRPLGFAGSHDAAARNAALRDRALAGLEGGAPVALSPLHFPVGLLSSDGTAVLGREGHLFLLAGSNGRVAALGRDRAERRRLLRTWLGLIAERQTRCRAAGIRYLQVIVPEKASFLPECLPEPATGGPSPLLRALEAVIARRRPALAAGYISGLAVLRGDGTGAAAGRGLPGEAGTARRSASRLDSHPSPEGLHALARAVLARLGAEVPAVPAFSEARPAGGDLVDRFFGTPFLDTLPHLPEGSWERFGGRPEVTGQHLPKEGAHIGRWEHSLAEGAPIPARLLVFGNSVCAGLGHGQNGLSGWLARLFRELHFHWSPTLDWAVVEAVRPDIVLCQTVERFMGSVPDA